jgi:Histidine kinase-, DNA gyrase B-, and HSP90-like ATPase
VIANLVENAQRAKPERGTVHVLVGVDAIVEVIDHGEGVAEADRETIFEPFWRKSKITPGARLGLAIAKELMDVLGRPDSGGRNARRWRDVQALVPESDLRRSARLPRRYLTGVLAGKI